MDYKSNAKAAKTQGTILCAFAAFAFKKDLVGTLPKGRTGVGPRPLRGVLYSLLHHLHAAVRIDRSLDDEALRRADAAAGEVVERRGDNRRAVVRLLC